MRKKISLFLILSCILLLCFGLRFGGDFWRLVKRNVAVKFYNGVLELFIPGVSMSGDQQTVPIYDDLASSLLPSLYYHEELLWYDSQAEDWADYEYLAAQENEQMELFIAENESAYVGQSAETAASGNEVASDPSAGAEPEEPVQMAAAETGKKVTVNREKLYDFDYLRQNFYIVDSSTTIGSDQLNVEKLLGKDMTITDEGEGPQILIYHTHSQEGYIDSTEGDADTSVVAVGEYLAQILTEEYGFRVLHHTGEYDVGDRDHAYSNAAPALAELLQEYPSIQVVIDVHRDSVSDSTHLVTEINGKQTAKIMFFNGLSRTTTSGDLTNLPNPYIEDNLALSFQLQLAAAEYYPDFTRKIYLKGYRYNMHYCPKSILVEVGAQNNTLEEAMNAMEPLADILSKVLTGTE